MKPKMTEVEQKLIKLLRNSLSGDLIVGIEEFEKYYWSLSDELLNWNSELGTAIQDFADSLEYFEKLEEQRDHHPHWPAHGQSPRRDLHLRPLLRLRPHQRRIHHLTPLRGVEVWAPFAMLTSQEKS